MVELYPEIAKFIEDTLEAAMARSRFRYDPKKGFGS